MNVGESGSEKSIQYEVSVQLPVFVCMDHYFHRLLISSYHMHIRSLFIKTLTIINSIKLKRYESPFSISFKKSDEFE